MQPITRTVRDYRGNRMVETDRVATAARDLAFAVENLRDLRVTEADADDAFGREQDARIVEKLSAALIDAIARDLARCMPIGDFAPESVAGAFGDAISDIGWPNEDDFSAPDTGMSDVEFDYRAATGAL